MAKAKTKDNVIQLRNEQDEILQTTYAQAFVCLRALNRLKAKLETAAKASQDEWKKKLADAMAKFVDPIKQEFDRVSAGLDVGSPEWNALRDLYAERYLDAILGLKEHADLKAKADADKAEHNKRIGLVESTVLECLGASTSAQVDLFATREAGSLGWATAQGRQIIFAALIGISKDGGTLDPIQAKIAADLGGEGVDAMDLGVAASVAVEADDADEEPLTDDDGPTNVGF